MSRFENKEKGIVSGLDKRYMIDRLMFSFFFFFICLFFRCLVLLWGITKWYQKVHVLELLNKFHSIFLSYKRNWWIVWWQFSRMDYVNFVHIFLRFDHPESSSYWADTQSVLKYACHSHTSFSLKEYSTKAWQSIWRI